MTWPISFLSTPDCSSAAFEACAARSFAVTLFNAPLHRSERRTLRTKNDEGLAELSMARNVAPEERSTRENAPPNAL